MSSFYDDASLVMIPSCYKVSTVLCEKPTDGSGDLTFTRTGDTATRVNSSGLVEKVRTNVLTFSQDFSNASWIFDPLLARTLNQTDPNGGTTAALYTATAGSNLTFGKNVTLIANAPNTVSIWIKGNASGSVSLRIDDSTLGPQTNINYTTSWQRFSVTRTVNRANCQFVVGGYSTWGTGKTLSFAFAQAEAGDIMTDYIPTTTAAVSVGPVANLARLDYLNSSCPRLLLEPQRTNLVTYSEQINNAAWTKSAGGTGIVPVVTANDTTSPDGYQNADKVVFNSGAGTTGTDQSMIDSVGFSVTNGTTYTGSFWARGAVGGEQLAFRHVGGFTKITLTTSWQRYTLTTTAGYTGTGYFTVGIRRGLVEPLNSSATVFIWGAQLEVGSFATSYIPTLAASATRSVDATSKTGISSLIGQTNGTAQMTFVMDFDTSGDSTTMLGIHAGTSTANRIQLTSRFGTVRLLVIANNSIVTNDLLYDAAPNEVVNVAFKYGSAGVTAYVNGTQRYTTASAVVFTETMTLFTIGNRSNIDDYGKGQRVSQSLLFKSALTNAQLAELTTI